MHHVVCFGNPLHGDDGFGPAVYRKLVESPLPEGLRAFDAGTAGLSALALFEACEEVTIVDVLRSGGEPGRLHLLAAEAIAPERAGIGHEAGVGYLLRALAALPGPKPRVRVLAAEAASIRSFAPGLSAPVAAAVEPAATFLRRHFAVPAAVEASILDQPQA